MGKRSAAGELFLGNMGSIQWEIRPSIQREDQLTMETKLEQIAAKTKAAPPICGVAGSCSAVKHLPKSVVREIRTLRSVGTGGGRPPPVTRWAASRDAPLSRLIGLAAWRYSATEVDGWQPRGSFFPRRGVCSDSCCEGSRAERSADTNGVAQRARDDRERGLRVSSFRRRDGADCRP